MKAVPLEMQPGDLRWIAQTVHNAYHPVDMNKYWFDCPKTVCEYIRKELEKHYDLMYVKYGSYGSYESYGSDKQLYIDQNMRRKSKENV